MISATLLRNQINIKKYISLLYYFFSFIRSALLSQIRSLHGGLNHFSEQMISHDVIQYEGLSSLPDLFIALSNRYAFYDLDHPLRIAYGNRNSVSAVCSTRSAHYYLWGIPLSFPARSINSNTVYSPKALLLLHADVILVCSA